jgi:hypothetical protein
VAVVSVWHDKSLGYGDTAPSNSTAFTGYDEDRCWRLWNAMGQCLIAAGATTSNAGTREWNPLRKWIDAGQRVFILPNLVMHRRAGEAEGAFESKCTHGSIIFPIVDYAMRAAGSAALVAFGNAPLQGCDYERVTSQSGAARVSEYYGRTSGVNIGPFDLRALKSRWTAIGTLVEREESHEDVVYVDLGRYSLLDGYYGAGVHEVAFRVGDYPTTATSTYHAKGAPRLRC